MSGMLCSWSLDAEAQLEEAERESLEEHLIRLEKSRK
jgi:hypothetical protein